MRTGTTEAGMRAAVGDPGGETAGDTGGSNGAAGERTRWRRLGWFVGLWLASVSALGVVAYLIRWVLAPG